MLSDADKKIIYKLVEELTGASKSGEFGQETLMVNVERRMSQLELDSLVDYLGVVDKDPEEYTRLVSMLTIHTTSWFRENPHFVAFQEILLEVLKKNEVFKVWCAACSTGEEVYSFALMLEEFRRVHPKFDYRILGTDIDVLSLRTAEQAVYPKKQINFHVARYKAHVLEGSGATEDYFTLSKDIRERCEFRRHDLREATAQSGGPFHVCICRNVLIYFSPETVSRVITNLLISVRTDGYLMLGHSESVNAAEYGLVQEGHSVYVRPSKANVENKRQPGKYRVLSIDDSAVMRRFYEKTFNQLGFETVTVSTASEGTGYLNFNEVDLITLDLNMPDQRGDKWLEMERREGLRTPVVIISDVHASDAAEVVGLLAMGAQDYIEKDKLRRDPKKIKEGFIQLIQAQNQKPNMKTIGGSAASVRPDVVLIGASTGGPQALVKLLSRMPMGSPPVVIIQHMSPKFTKPMGERLADTSGLKLGNIAKRGPILPAHLYMAYGDYHLGIGEDNSKLILDMSEAPAFNGHRPSVDYMFNSALGLKCSVMAILLTGMGRDGALGLRFLRKEGAFCIAQSEKDCVVYGMPREAIERGAADYVGTIDEIRSVMEQSFSLNKKTAV